MFLRAGEQVYGWHASVTRFVGFVGTSVTRFALSNVAESIHFLRSSEQLIGFVGMPVAACSLSNDRCY